MFGWLDAPVVSVLQRSLDAASERQRVLANNVSNVDTPNFKRSDVDFEHVLSQALGVSDGKLPLKISSGRHIPGNALSAESYVVTDENTTIRLDGNNVSIEREMANIAENSLYYNSVTRALSSQLGHLRMVIQQKP